MTFCYAYTQALHRITHKKTYLQSVLPGNLTIFPNPEYPFILQLFSFYGFNEAIISSNY